MSDSSRTRDPTTMAGRALIGWIKPHLRGGLRSAVVEIEDEAASTALRDLRARVAAIDPAPTDVLALIDELLDEAALR